MHPATSAMPGGFQTARTLDAALKDPLSLSTTMGNFPTVGSGRGAFRGMSSISELSAIVVFPTNARVHVLPPMSAVIATSKAMDTLGRSLTAIDSVRPFSRLSLMSPF